MTRRILPYIAVIVAMYFDSIFFDSVHIFGVRPDVMLAFTVSFSVLSGMIPGALMGLFGGLIMDIMFGRMIGLNAMLYFTAGIAGGYFFGKFYADNVVIPTVTAMAASVLKDLVYALAAALLGAQYSFGWMFALYIIPAALFTGLVCMLVHVPFRAVLGRYGGRTKGLDR